MPDGLVWIRVFATGAEWEVPAAKAAELTRWYPKDYAVIAPSVPPDAPAEHPADAPASEPASEPAKPKKAK
jgi:hypothetical protein